LREWMRRVFVWLPLLALLAFVMANSVAGDATADYQRGLDMMKAQQYSEAIVVFETIASSDSALAPMARLQGSRCHRLNGESSKARDWLARGIELASSRGDQNALVELKTELADINLRAARFDQVIEICQDPSLLATENGKLMLATAYFEKDSLDNALTAFDNLISASLGSVRLVEYKLMRVECLAKMDRYDQVYAGLQDVVTNHPSASLIEGRNGNMVSWTLEQTVKRGTKADSVRLSELMFNKLTVETAALMP